MFCSKCGKEVADDAQFCQFCGNKLTKEEEKEIDLSMHKPNYEEAKTPFWFPLIGIGMLLFFVLLMIPEKPIEEDEYAQEILARSLCQQNVQERLPNPKGVEFNRNEDVAKKIDNMFYNVYSSLYTQNMFGATVKMNYSCKVKITDKNSGIVSDVVIR